MNYFRKYNIIIVCLSVFAVVSGCGIKGELSRPSDIFQKEEAK